jgi:hypothetical protein
VQRLAGEIQQGTVSLPQALNRVNGYVGNARVQFWEAERERRQADPGQAIVELRVLGVAEHCQDCVDYYDRGWCAAGQLPVPGVDSECSTHCRCTMEHRQVPAAELGDWLGRDGGEGRQHLRGQRVHQVWWGAGQGGEAERGNVRGRLAVSPSA